MPAKTVLITGTTSGIGKSLLEHYAQLGWNIISVNRRHVPELEKRHPQVRFEVVDIASLEAVRTLLRQLQQDNLSPSLYVLNAGINPPDNQVSGFDFLTFENVLRVNLLGAMTFISAARELGAQGVSFLGISSTANLVPNHQHLAYHLSKWSLHQALRLLQKSDPANSYKSVVLGPVEAGTLHERPGFRGWLLRFLARDVTTASQAIARFAEKRRKVLYFPLSVYAFYCFVRVALQTKRFASP